MADPYYSNVSLLLPMTGANNSIVFTDYSPTPKTITRNGDTKILTAQSKWGNGSGYFDGTGDYLSTPADTSFNMGSGNFTVELWAYFTANPSSWGGDPGVILVGQTLAAVSGRSFELGIFGSSLANCSFWPEVFSGSTRYGSQAAGQNLSLNTWHHFALVRNGSTLLGFINGIQVASTAIGTITVNSSSNPMMVARFNDETYQYCHQGYIQDLRITKGIARYTANFTPPGSLSPLSTIGGTVTVAGNGGAQQVVIRRAATRELEVIATPDATTGVWAAEVAEGTYDITYFAADCQPICHGPYTVA